MDKKANYYDILGVELTAQSADIKSAYRKLARKYHPDVSGNTPEVVQKFKDITTAYETLLDSEERRKYDIKAGLYYARKEAEEKIHGEELKKAKEKAEAEAKKAREEAEKQEARRAYNRNRAGKDFRKDSGFSAVLNDIIGNLKGNKEKEKKMPPKNGDDITCDISLTMIESINGCKKTVNILVTEPCKACHGRKFINGSQCKICSGRGEFQNHKKITVKIPAGVKTGSKIRIPNEGNKGLYGGKNGDLYLDVKIEHDNNYEYDGLNINCTLNIPPYDAVLGTSEEISTPNGKVSMKVMPNTTQGQKYRLANQGLKKGGKTGDIIVTVNIDIPKKLSKEEVDLYKKLKSLAEKDKVK